MSKTIPMSEKDYHYWSGRLEQFDDLPDGAWWASCEATIGGYNRMMSWLEASKIYDKEPNIPEHKRQEEQAIKEIENKD